MSDKAWKATERKIAALLGGERVPVTGRFRGSAPDIQHPKLSIEVKDRQSLPSWLLDAMNQADASNPDNKIPIVILHQKGMRFEDCLTLVRLGDIIRLLEEK